jgi:hypothetical protein
MKELLIQRAQEMRDVFSVASVNRSSDLSRILANEHAKEAF